MDRKTESRGHLLFEAAQQRGWSNATEIAEFAGKLERGLPAEDELAVILHWLGRCRLVHRLDQFTFPPDVRKRFRVPDLLAAFEVEGSLIPVLIEVKSSRDSVLSWKSEYLKSLQDYASLVGLPLLIAWKCQSLWVLFEAIHFKKVGKKMKVQFFEMMRETLLGLLAGDFTFSFHVGVGAHIKARKVRPTVNGFHGVIEDAYFTNRGGRRFSGEGGMFQFFACVDQQVEVQETEEYVLQSFVVSESHQSEFAHRAIATILSTFGEDPDPFGWRKILQEGLPGSAVPPWDAAQYGLKNGFVRHVMRVRPKTSPSFFRSKEDRVGIKPSEKESRSENSGA